MKSNKNLPKILVGSPVYSNKKYITPYWIENVKNLAYENYDIVVVDNSKQNTRFERIFEKEGIKVIKSEYYTNPFKRLTEARKKLNNYVIEKDYDFLMSIEQDIIVPLDILTLFLSHKKKIIGGPYIVSSHTNNQRRCIDYVISASKLDKVLDVVDSIDVNEWYLASEIENKGLIQVKSCSLGCTLIDIEIIKSIEVRYNPEINRADDSYFFHDCYKKGIDVFLDTSLLWGIDHIKRLGGEIPVGGIIKHDGN